MELQEYKEKVAAETGLEIFGNEQDEEACEYYWKLGCHFSWAVEYIESQRP